MKLRKAGCWHELFGGERITKRNPAMRLLSKRKENGSRHGSLGMNQIHKTRARGVDSLPGQVASSTLPDDCNEPSSPPGARALLACLHLLSMSF